jgi:hypothetical protein
MSRWRKVLAPKKTVTNFQFFSVPPFHFRLFALSPTIISLSHSLSLPLSPLLNSLPISPILSDCLSLLTLLLFNFFFFFPLSHSLSPTLSASLSLHSVSPLSFPPSSLYFFFPLFLPITLNSFLSLSFTISFHSLSLILSFYLFLFLLLPPPTLSFCLPLPFS